MRVAIDERHTSVTNLSRSRRRDNPAEESTSSEAMSPSSKASRRALIKGVDISPEVRVSLYAQQRYLPLDFSRKSGLLLPFVTYFQDPFVAKEDPAVGFDRKAYVQWEPGLMDGPTSARFAVVDYNADTGMLEPPAKWDEQLQQFTGGDGSRLDERAARTFAFHQVNVWVLLQRALAFFEDGSGLGRRVPWAFEGNRLIVVPHAGYGENAYYDRRSKSLQFYYFGSEADTIFTCLSTDIVCHEFGHAVLDGVRPFLNESSSLETAAFHEFMGDLTAILLTLRNNSLRRQEADATQGDISKSETLSSIAEEFGNAVQGRPYLRTARNPHKMWEVVNETDPHRMSEVLTGAMFDVLMRLAEHYSENPADHAGDSDAEAQPKSPRQVFWRSADRMQRMAIQPLDLLPPVEVTFRDYALAVCRSQKLADPIDPHGYYDMLIEVFRKRGILSVKDARELKEPRYLNERLRLSVHHSIDDISRSLAAAYRFLDDNREDLLIPANRDFFVADLYDAKKRARQNAPLPRQIVLQYLWREEVLLDGPQFGRFNALTTTMLCGGTLVFDDNGNVLSWAMKPGSIPYGGKRQRGGKIRAQWDDAVRQGEARRHALLENVAAQVAAGRIGTVAGSEKGLLGSQAAPMTAEVAGNDLVRFQLSPHLQLLGDRQKHAAEETGARRWQISC